MLNQNGVTKTTSENNLECDDSVPPWNCKKCKNFFIEETTVLSKESSKFVNVNRKEVKFPRKCNRCNRIFLSKIVYLKHKQKCKQRYSRSKTTIAPHLCDICLQLFDCEASFDKHKKRCLHRCIHPGCYNSFISRLEMITHLYEDHMGDQDVHYLEFKNRNMLNLWKINEAIVNMLSYENKSFQDISHHYFTCHRAGTGRDDSSFSCPARMLIYESNSSVEVEYVPIHNHELLPDDIFDYESHVPLICLYPDCIHHVSFYKQSEMLSHLQQSHKRSINCQYMDFNNIVEFFLWKENSTSEHFIYLFRLKGYAVSKSVNLNYHYYLCGFNGKHSLDKPTQCLARMVVYESESCVKVKYFPYHIHPLKSVKITREKLSECCDVQLPLVPSESN